MKEYCDFMKKRGLHLENNALDSHFLIYKVNEPITIYEGDFSLSDDEDVLFVNGIVKLDFMPKPNIVFSGIIITEEEKSFRLHNQLFEKKNIEIQISGMMESPVMITHHSIGNDREQIAGIVTNSYLETEAQFISKMTFCTVNFLDFLGRGVKHANLEYRGRTKFSFEEWEITIDKRYDYSKKYKDVFGQLKSSGGYSITHIGSIQRTDQKTFLPGDVEYILKSVQWLLSFAAGRFVGICVLEGFYEDYRIWKKYQSPSFSNWNKPITWFPKQDSESLEVLFPLVLKKQEDPLWNKVLWEVLWWYIDSQSETFIEKRVVSAQVALETLAWVYLIEDGNSNISRTKYGKASAAKNLEALLKGLSIDSVIPDRLMDFREDYDDGPHLFTTIRNEIVHPSRKSKLKDNNTKYQILNLGIWYMEMVILGILGYSGKYANRLKMPLWEGEYEYVPWI
jgi:hypothetical protein